MKPLKLRGQDKPFKLFLGCLLQRSKEKKVNTNFSFRHICKSCVYVCIACVSAVLLVEARRSQQISWSQNTGGCGPPPRGCWEPRSGPLQEQLMLLAAKIYSQAPQHPFYPVELSAAWGRKQTCGPGDPSNTKIVCIHALQMGTLQCLLTICPQLHPSIQDRTWQPVRIHR